MIEIFFTGALFVFACFAVYKAVKHLWHVIEYAVQSGRRFCRAIGKEVNRKKVGSPRDLSRLPEGRAQQGGGQMATQQPRYDRAPYRREPADRDPRQQAGQQDWFGPAAQRQGAAPPPPPPTYQPPAQQPVQVGGLFYLRAMFLLALLLTAIGVAGGVYGFYIQSVPRVEAYGLRDAVRMAAHALAGAQWAIFTFGGALIFLAIGVVGLANRRQTGVTTEAYNALASYAQGLESQLRELADGLDRQRDELSAVRSLQLGRDDVRDEFERGVRDRFVSPERVNELLRQAETRLQRALDAKADNTNVGEIGVQIVALHRAIDDLSRELGTHTHPTPPAP